jgi:plastocyanin
VGETAYETAMRMRAAPVALVAAALFAAAGCGGEDEESSEAGGTAQATVSISETEFKLDPSTVTLDAAGTYTFKAVNDGSADHALEIEGNGVEEETDTIGPGESAEVTVELEKGTYEIYCPIGNHKDQGMEGSVSVAGGGGSGTGEDEDETETGSSGYG